MRRPLGLPRLIALAPLGRVEPGVVVAACRAGALGSLDFGIDFSAGSVADAAAQVVRFCERPFGLRLPAPEIQATLLRGSPQSLSVLIGTEADGPDWPWAVAQ